MDDDHLKWCLLTRVALDGLFQPLGLFGTVIVESRETVVLDVAVWLILAAVQHDKEDGTLAKRVV